MTTKDVAPTAYRPALCLSDALCAETAGLIHMGRRLYSGREIAACGVAVWCWGSAFNPGYRVCEGCIEAAGFDPRPGRTAVPMKQASLF